MNHKRRRPKNSRGGCLLCKPHKGNGMKGRRAHQSLAELRSREDMAFSLREAAPIGTPLRRRAVKDDGGRLASLSEST